MTAQEIAASVAKTEALASWPERWNGYDALAPLPAAILHGKLFLRDRGEAVATVPNVTSDGDGNVVYEWWLEDRKFTVYVEPNAISVVRVDGDLANSEIAYYEGLPI